MTIKYDNIGGVSQPLLQPDQTSAISPQSDNAAVTTSDIYNAGLEQQIQQLLQTLSAGYPQVNFNQTNISLAAPVVDLFVNNNGTNIRYAGIEGAVDAPITITLNFQSGATSPPMPFVNGTRLNGVPFVSFVVNAASVAGASISLITWSDNPQNRVIYQ